MLKRKKEDYIVDDWLIADVSFDLDYFIEEEDNNEKIKNSKQK